MTDTCDVPGLSQAVQRYFDLMYDCDTRHFDRVFRPTAQLHGFRDGAMTVWPAPTYKDILASRASPKSLNSPREEAVLLMDFASDTQALVKVRVRINSTVFVDYLTWHHVDGDWLITSKAYHVERSDPPSR
ncbi:MAG TPA: nuclear transport factor 2 family protein [Vineibacter sp.]|nr:nuclear transport factor 2 family protein [Vineibacter sp.]